MSWFIFEISDEVLLLNKVEDTNFFDVVISYINKTVSFPQGIYKTWYWNEFNFVFAFSGNTHELLLILDVVSFGHTASSTVFTSLVNE